MKNSSGFWFYAENDNLQEKCFFKFLQKQGRILRNHLPASGKLLFLIRFLHLYFFLQALQKLLLLQMLA